MRRIRFLVAFHRNSDAIRRRGKIAAAVLSAMVVIVSGLAYMLAPDMSAEKPAVVIPPSHEYEDMAVSFGADALQLMVASTLNTFITSSTQVVLPGQVDQSARRVPNLDFTASLPLLLTRRMEMLPSPVAFNTSYNNGSLSVEPEDGRGLGFGLDGTGNGVTYESVLNRAGDNSGYCNPVSLETCPGYGPYNADVYSVSVIRPESNTWASMSLPTPKGCQVTAITRGTIKCIFDDGSIGEVENGQGVFYYVHAKGQFSASFINSFVVDPY